jgi:hypothetical protein
LRSNSDGVANSLRSFDVERPPNRPKQPLPIDGKYTGRYDVAAL